MDDSANGSSRPDDAIVVSLYAKFPDLPRVLAAEAVPVAIIDRQLNVCHNNGLFARFLRPIGMAAFREPHFISSHHEHAFRHAVEDAFNGNIRRLHAMAFRGPSGAVVCFEARLFPMRDRSGRQLVAALFNDVTEIVRDRQRHRSLRWWIAVAELANILAHELNSPLAAILGFSQLLTRQKLSPEAVDDLNRISESAERCRRVVDRLLSCVRRQHTSPTDVNVNELVVRTVAAFSDELEAENICTQLSLDPALPAPHADPHHLEAVVTTMIDNACQAMAAGGTLTIQTRGLARGEQPGPAPAAHETRQWIQIRFADTGPAIPAEALPRVFEPFFVARGESAVNIGLSICLSIIKRHGGDICVEQTSGRGTTFLVTLPVGESRSGADRSSQPNTAHTRARKVLVIDDDPSCCSLIAMALAREGHTAHTARDGREAIDSLQTQAYDVIIADVKMPRMDGRTFYEEVRRRDPELARRIVFVTGDSVGSETQNFLRTVPNPRLMKPFDVDKVNRIVREI